MRTTQQLSITLPNEMAEAIKTKVRAGEYATESEVIRNRLPALLNRYRDIENWLQNEVGASHDALKSNQSPAVAVDQVRARLTAENTKVS
jgi:antitoxin ParD1/3/4